MWRLEYGTQTARFTVAQLNKYTLLTLRSASNKIYFF
jgi:hypothetical protein